MTLANMQPALRNFTIALPAGTSTHGDPHLLCPPTQWETIVIFFVVNFIAHAATVKLPPAPSNLIKIQIFFGALLMPSSGMVFAIQAFKQTILGLGKSKAQKAAIAGSLCMYARSKDWRPPGTLAHLQASMEALEFPKPSKLDAVFSPTFIFRRMQRKLQGMPAGFIRDCLSVSARSMIKHMLNTDYGIRQIFRLMSLSAPPEGDDIAIAEDDRTTNDNFFLTALRYPDRYT